MKSSLVSFVVPTRNRQHCLKSLLDTFQRFWDSGETNFNVVILDNSDVAFESALFRGLKFNYHYEHATETLSVVENFNKGVPLVTGDFACFIGDDDVISVRIFEFARLMKSKSIDAAIVSSNTKAIYFWPGVVDRRWGNVGGKLFLSNYSGKVKITDVRSELESVRVKCCDGPQSLPRAYSGIISKKAIQKVVHDHGALFGGCSPDIYSSRLLASAVSFVAFVDLPLIAAGASPASTSAARAERSDIGHLTDNDHLGRFRNLEWDERIPKFYSPFTVWSQSYLQAEKKLGNDTTSKALAYTYAKCFIFARGNSKHIIEAISKAESKFTLLFYTLIYMVVLPFLFGFTKFNLIFHRKPGGCSFQYNNIENNFVAGSKMDDAIALVSISICESPVSNQ